MPCWTWTRYLGTVRQSACNRPTNKNDTASILARWPGPREVGTLRQDWPRCQPSSRLASQTCSAMLLSQPRFLQIFSASSVWEWKAQYVDQIKRQRLGANCDWSCERFTLDPGLSPRGGQGRLPAPRHNPAPGGHLRLELRALPPRPRPLAQGARDRRPAPRKTAGHGGTGLRSASYRAVIASSVVNGDAGNPSELNRLTTGAFAHPYRTYFGSVTPALPATTVLPSMRATALAGRPSSPAISSPWSAPPLATSPLAV